MLMKLAQTLLAGIMLLAMAACSTTVINTGGPRPPQGPGPAGTNFGFWDRDAEGAVDQDFRRFIGYQFAYAAIWFVLGVLIFTFLPA